MKDMITKRLASLSQEVESLMQERQDMQKRDQDIEIRLHQLVGAIYELQHITADLDRQASEEALMDLEAVGYQSQPTHPSEGDDQDNRQELLVEIEKNSRQQS